MSISTPPPPAPPKKKSGCGCLGCGCGVLALLAALFIGFMALGFFGIYKGAMGMTSTSPTDIPIFNGGPEVFNSASQKMAAFQQELKDHKPASLHLTGDEINSLIANSPDAAKNNIKANVTLTDGDAHVQACVPTSVLTGGYITGRYATIDATFTVGFDITTKSLLLNPEALQIGDKPFLGPDTPEAQLKQMQKSFAPVFSQSMTSALRHDPGYSQVLDHTRNIEVKNGELVIETE